MARSRKPSVWIEKYKNTRGYVSYRVRAEKDGVRLPTVACGQDRRHAVETRDRLRSELWAGRLGLARPSTKTLADFAEQALAYSKAHKAESTWLNFDTPALKSFVAHLGRERDIGSLSREDVEGWKMALLDAGLGPTTVGMRLRSVKSVLGYAVRLGLLQANPSSGIQSPKTERVGRVLLPAEISVLIDRLPMVVSRGAWFTLQTGVRLSEILALDWRWVGVAEEPWTAELQVTKGGKPRMIHLNRQARAAMGGVRPDGQVFTGLSRDVIHSHMARITRQHGLGRIRWHDLRHTWATEYMRKTGDLPGLMLEGGWSSLAAVACYQHLSRHRAGAVELIDYGVNSPHCPPKSHLEGSSEDR